MLKQNDEIIFAVHVLTGLQVFYISLWIDALYSFTIVFLLTLVFSLHTNKFHMWVCKIFFSPSSTEMFYWTRRRGVRHTVVHYIQHSTRQPLLYLGQQARLPHLIR